MKTEIEVTANDTCVTLVIRSRDDLERALPWLERLRVLFPYPTPPSDPKPGEFDPGDAPAPTVPGDA